MRKFWLLVVFYCVVHGTGGDFFVRYEGMDKSAIAKLIQKTYAAKFDFVSEASYKAFLDKQKNKY